MDRSLHVSKENFSINTIAIHSEKNRLLRFNIIEIFAKMNFP